MMMGILWRVELEWKVRSSKLGQSCYCGIVQNFRNLSDLWL